MKFGAVIIFFILSLEYVDESQCRSCVIHSDLDLVDRYCHTHLLWNHTECSLIGCAMCCYQDRRCHSIQYNRITQLCQGHYNRLTVDDCSSGPGFKTFAMCGRGTSVGAPCLTDVNCTARNTICTNQICWCIPGYLYSPRSHACVDKCEVYANTFQLIPNQTTSDYDNIVMNYTVSPEECLDVCTKTTDFFCRAVDINKFKKTCYLSETSQMMAAKENRAWSIYYSYQRECAP